MTWNRVGKGRVGVTMREEMAAAAAAAAAAVVVMVVVATIEAARFVYRG